MESKMTFWESLILGSIQGVTEFLPISSSGHLVIIQSILGVNLPGNDFEILVHLGTLGSILYVFQSDILEILRSLKKKSTRLFIVLIILGTLPAIFIGLNFKDQIALLFENITNVSVALIFTGIVLILTFFLERKDLENNFSKAFLIGVFQSIAIIPGISRSGMTISIAMLLGLSPKKAAKFSFMLAIPAISGAGILTALDTSNGFLLPYQVLFGGFISSFLVGILSLNILLKLLKAGKFHFFGVYCILIGLLTLVL
jgi:undecaprenyl-diphosphatase